MANKPESSTQVAAAPVQNQGMAATLFARADPAGFHQAMSSGNILSLNNPQQSMGSLFEAIKSMLGGIAQMFGGSGNLASIGNDVGQTLTKTMAALTGSNPTINAVSPAGKVVDMGPVAEIAANDPNMNPKPMPSNAPAISGVKTPTLGMG